MEERKDKSKSWSGQLREQLFDQVLRHPVHWAATYSAACAASMHRGRACRMQSQFPQWLEWLKHVTEDRYGDRAECVIEGRSVIWSGLTAKLLIDDTDRFLRLNPTEIGTEWNSEERNHIYGSILRGLYLACGSMADPRERYHLEFSFVNRGSALWSGLLFEDLELEPGWVTHQGNRVLYFKEGTQLAEFLLRSGAHKALLEFEEIRVRKDVRNQVNRLVNCDHANAQRLADSSAKQLAAIRHIDLVRGLDSLPDDLRQLATLRLENPEFSLRELGEIMEPPLGKSAVNHRFSKLLNLAAELT